MSGDGDSIRRPVLGLAVAVAVIAMLAAPRLLPIPTASDTEIGIAFSILLVGLIAGLLVARRPDHPISWLLAAAAISGGVAGLSAQALPAGLTDLAWWQATLAIISGPAWYGLLAMILVFVPLLFPTGMPPSRRWRWLGWTVGVTTVVYGFAWMIQERFCTQFSEGELCLTSVRNPIGIEGMSNPEENILGMAAYTILLVGALFALVSLFLRYRRSELVEREQIKWVAYSMSLFVGFTLLLDVLWMDLLGHSEPAGYWLVNQLLWVTIPASIAVAILRYKLYEIDRIVSRTVSYALIAVFLFAVYAGGVIGVQTVLPQSEEIAVAASTLAAVALFAPLRRRVQSAVDRRFNRRRYDAERVVESFAGRLREAVDLNTVTDELRTVVATTVEPATAAFWLRAERGKSARPPRRGS